MSSNRYASPFQFRMRNLLVLVFVCGVLSAAWPRNLPLEYQGALLLWTVVALVQFISWRAARVELRGTHAEQPVDAGHHKTAYVLGLIAVLGPMATWTLAMCLSIASRFVDDAWSSTATHLFVPLRVVNTMSVPLLLFSMSIYWHPIKNPGFLIMRLAGIANVAIYWWMSGRE